MTSLPRIDVVIPYFQRAATIARAAVSALEQQGVAVEVIAVDDGSHDDGGERLSALDDQRIVLLRHPTNRGAAAARNTGIAAASAPLVAFLDSDDAFLPGKLAAQAALMTAERLDLCFGGFELVGQGGIRTVRLDPPSRGWALSFLDGCFVSPGSTLLARREALARLGRLEERLGRFEDWDFMLRAAGEGLRFGAVATPVAWIAPAPHPAPAVIEPALGLLAELHQGAIASRWGAAARRRFLASLALERAVARWRHGDAAGALVGLTGAVASPTRLLAFAGRVARRAIAKRPASE